MTPMRNAVLTLALLLAAVATAGCRRVMVVKLVPPATFTDTSSVNSISVEAPGKQVAILTALSQTVGYVDLTETAIAITVRACRGDQLVLQQAEGFNCPVADECDVPLHPVDPPTPCNVTLLPDGGAPADARDGSAGGDGDAAAGGGQDGAGPDGGGCDDANHVQSICPTPAGDPGDAGVPAVAVSSACTDYCAKVFTPVTDGTVLCAGQYADERECQQYCTLASWSAGVSSTDTDNTFSCRNTQLSIAATLATSGGDRSAICNKAGPSGGINGCGMACNVFCDAWSGICGNGSGAAACLTACTRFPNLSPQQTCRFGWLVRAASDRRYCPLIDYATSTCTVPGCPAP